LGCSLWFKILPRSDASYYALSALNIGASLVGVWRLSGLLLRRYARLSTVSLLLFTPSYQYLATNFNANTILLSIWPWTAYYFVKSLQTHAWKDGIAFGSLCGCALLAKYYSILLLASCLFAALLHPRRRAYFRSGAPYCAVAVCVAIFAPHAWWAYKTIVLEIRGAEGRLERLPELRAELVGLNVDVLVAGGTAAALAAKNATQTIPIVMAGSDPVGLGLVGNCRVPVGT
jgi:4-amino-4-deoxy-L-arabinose transferase-like glycosyltransferase